MTTRSEMLCRTELALKLLEKGMTQAQLPERLGISKSMVSRLLRKAKRAKEVERAGKLADILGANI